VYCNGANFVAIGFLQNVRLVLPLRAKTIGANLNAKHLSGILLM